MTAATTEAADSPDVLLQAALADAKDAWKTMLKRKFGSEGPIIPNDLNAAIALRHSPTWTGRMRFNQFSQIVEMDGRPMVDEDALVFARWAQGEGLDIGKGIAFDALVSIAREQAYNPLQDMLRSLRHDGKERVEDWLIECGAAEDTPLVRAYSKRFLIAMVARALSPGCKVDTVLILESPQGLKKSTLFEELCGKAEWFTDGLGDISRKDAAENIAGKWVVEMSELDSVGRSEVSTTKRFISSRVDRYRPAYGKVSRDFPRQCVLVGTVNPAANGYLKDDTGARRFWPVAIGIGQAKGWKVNIEWLRANREQLLAEAVALYEKGEPWWLETAELEEEQQASADERYEADPWEQTVVHYLADKQAVVVGDVLGEALHLSVAERTKVHANKVGAILRRLGWTRKPARVEVIGLDGVKTKKLQTAFVAPSKVGTASESNVVSLKPAVAGLKKLFDAA